MGMPCELNTVLKLSPSQGYPYELVMNEEHEGIKEGYRILPVGVRIPLLDQEWKHEANVIIKRLVWEDLRTTIRFEIDEILY